MKKKNHETDPSTHESATMRQRRDYQLCDAISEQRVEQEHPELVAFRQRLVEKLPQLPDEARPHQHEKLQALFLQIAQTPQEEIDSGTGFGVVSPTGSGKTVMIAMATKIMADAGLKVLVLSPRKKITRQIVGDEKRGFTAFAPDIAVGEYSGDKKDAEQRVTVMMYQALRGAVHSGDMHRLDPDVIICDEMHLAVSGYWGGMVRALQKGRLSIGLTATPGDPSGVNASYTFPNIVSATTLRQGIEQGMLSDLEAYTYKGVKPVLARKINGEYNQEELAQRFLNAEENYLTARIVAEEVASGRSGLVKCSAGMDRIHAKIMHGILSQTDVPTLNRKLVVEYIDGEMHPDALEEIFERKDRGEIDVLVSVDMFSLGYDGLREEFLVVVPPTMSYVGLEQLVGRVLRPKDGKIAHVHQFVYDTHDMPQVLVQEVVGERGIQQGVSVRNGELKHYAAKVKKYGGPLIELGSFQPSDEEIRRKLAALQGLPVREFSIRASKRFLPYDWKRSSSLARTLNTSLEEIERMLVALPIEPRIEIVDDTEIAFFPPEAEQLLAEQLGVTVFDPTTHMSLSDVHELARQQTHQHYIGRTAVISLLAEQGFDTAPLISPSGVIRGYLRAEIEQSFHTVSSKQSTLSIRPKRSGAREKVIDSSPEKPDNEFLARSSFAKLAAILVHPTEYAGDPRSLDTVQRKLVSLITHMRDPRRRRTISGDFLNTARELLADGKHSPSPAMISVARKQGVSIEELLFAATRL